MIPRRLAEGLPVTGKALCKPVGSSFMADSVRIRVQVGCIDKEVSAAVTPDDFMVHPLIGRNVGIDELLECAVVTRVLQKKSAGSDVHAVTTRAQSAKEKKAEQQAEVNRLAEQAVITNLVKWEASPVEAEESQLNALEVEEDDPTSGQDDGEPLTVVKDKVDAELSLGLVIPSVELGASLGAEYKGALGSDETLKEWKGWGTTRTNGFLWEDGILKRVVEDVIMGSRELVVIPVGMRQHMLALVHDYLGHVGSGKMIWMLKQSCCWPGLSGDAKRYGRACGECQKMRRGGLAEVPMGEMPIHKVPFENVAIDIVSFSQVS